MRATTKPSATAGDPSATDIARESPRGGGAAAIRAPRWPVHAITVLVGAFVVVVGGLWVTDHVIQGEPMTSDGWVIIAATILRAVTIGIALSSITRWGARIAPPVVLAGLWGCAAAQLVYPGTEAVLKTLALAGLVDLAPTGLGDMSATGWFNFTVMWLVFGVPGVLFAIAARVYRRRTGVRGWWGVAGVVAGAAFLFGLGAIIGTS